MFQCNCEQVLVELLIHILFLLPGLFGVIVLLKGLLAILSYAWNLQFEPLRSSKDGSEAHCFCCHQSVTWDQVLKINNSEHTRPILFLGENNYSYRCVSPASRRSSYNYQNMKPLSSRTPSDLYHFRKRDFVMDRRNYFNYDLRRYGDIYTDLYKKPYRTYKYLDPYY